MLQAPAEQRRKKYLAQTKKYSLKNESCAMGHEQLVISNEIISWSFLLVYM